jgi:hypothetical protein
MKRLLKAMWYSALPLIAIIVIIATMQGIVCGLEALGLDIGISVILTLFIFAYVVGVLFYYYKD